MHRLTLVVVIWLSCLGCSKSSSSPNNTKVITKPDTTIVTVDSVGPQPVIKTNSQKVYVHYLPWFETPQTSPDGKWGLHWTMVNENPDIITNGKRQIASYFYPMTGPYASSDRDILDYQLLLMKYSGIDGVIVDWNGTHNVYDYPLIKRNTDSLFSRVPNTGLQFSICYEDAQLANVKAVANIDTVTAAQQDFAYLQLAYFGSKSYVKINNQPLLLNFGPQGMKTPNDWQQAFSGLSVKPRLLPLAYEGNITGSAASGEFVWVQSSNLTSLQNFYSQRAPSLSTWFAGAYPGFQDFYKPGGWGNTLFLISYNGTGTLTSTLNLAKSANAQYLQLITWNDYGEGTMIEPTDDFGFTFLQAIQQYTGVKYTVTELQLIYKWYTLRAKYKGNTVNETQLTLAYNYLVSLQVTKAATIINGMN
ncbi:glycoside hydrolase family 71/99-like protein [Mucilaginibacter sp.]